jgi:uncharacterized C2H2 Zn-finger protein
MVQKSLNCPKCQFVGKSAQSLKVHTALVHKRGRKAKAKAKAKTAARGPRRRVFRRRSACPKCGKILKTPAAMKTHVTRMHKRGKRRSAAMKKGRGSALERDLMNLSLAGLADLHQACRNELQNRLASMVG